jgi:hypothetical protein
MTGYKVPEYITAKAVKRIPLGWKHLIALIDFAIERHYRHY